MGSCSTKQEIVSQSSATATPVAIVLRPSGFAKGSKVHASDSPFRSRVDSFRSRTDSFRTRADSKSLIDAVSKEIVKAGDKMKDNSDKSSFDAPIILVDKTPHDLKNNKNEDENGNGKSGKRNGSQSDEVKSKLNKKREKKRKQKAMRIGDFALIVEIKDQGKAMGIGDFALIVEIKDQGKEPYKILSFLPGKTQTASLYSNINWLHP